jgi:hypothetical protein
MLLLSAHFFACTRRAAVNFFIFANNGVRRVCCGVFSLSGSNRCRGEWVAAAVLLLRVSDKQTAVVPRRVQGAAPTVVH